MFDSTVYYAKVTVTASGGSLLAKATYYSDEACQDQLPNAYSVTFNNRYGGKLPDTGGPPSPWGKVRGENRTLKEEFKIGNLFYP